MHLRSYFHSHVLCNVGSAQLTLTSEPQISGTYCPGPVIFTCVGTQIAPSLFWQVNGSVMVLYSIIHEDDNFPLTLDINPPLDGVMALATSVSMDSPNHNIAVDITSVLIVNNMSILNGTTL